MSFTYNPANQLLTLKDGKAQTTKWNYDGFGRVTNKVDQANIEIFRYRYDANDRLTNRWTVAKGDTIYRYNPIGNLTNVDYPVTIMDIITPRHLPGSLQTLPPASRCLRHEGLEGQPLRRDEAAPGNPPARVGLSVSSQQAVAENREFPFSGIYGSTGM